MIEKGIHRHLCQDIRYNRQNHPGYHRLKRWRPLRNASKKKPGDPGFLMQGEKPLVVDSAWQMFNKANKPSLIQGVKSLEIVSAGTSPTGAVFPNGWGGVPFGFPCLSAATKAGSRTPCAWAG
jgi:hypothetical protein